MDSMKEKAFYWICEYCQKPIIEGQDAMFVYETFISGNTPVHLKSHPYHKPCYRESISKRREESLIMRTIIIRETHPKNANLSFVAFKESSTGRVTVKITDNLNGESTSLYGDDEIWWVFEKMHQLYDKVKGNF